MLGITWHSLQASQIVYFCWPSQPRLSTVPTKHMHAQHCMHYLLMCKSDFLCLGKGHQQHNIILWIMEIVIKAWVFRVIIIIIIRKLRYNLNNLFDMTHLFYQHVTFRCKIHISPKLTFLTIFCRIEKYGMVYLVA